MGKRNHREKGFTLLELLVVMSIIGVLSIVAIPKFNNAVVLANTSKIQMDLQTLDTAITLYQAQNGTQPASLSPDLAEYIVDVDKLKPPQGNCFLRSGDTIKITDSAYSLDTNGQRALCQSRPASDFGRADKK